MNYFELFGIPVQLKVDKGLLAKKYFELQKQFHPDFFTLADEQEQAEALEKSSQVNKALQTLKNEELTLKYILQLKHVLEEDEKYQLPGDFLMEVMELNENLDEKTIDKIAQFEQNIKAAIEELLVHYDHEKVTTAQLEQLKEYYFKKKYLHRILERMED